MKKPTAKTFADSARHGTILSVIGTTLLVILYLSGTLENYFDGSYQHESISFAMIPVYILGSILCFCPWYIAFRLRSDLKKINELLDTSLSPKQRKQHVVVCSLIVSISTSIYAIITLICCDDLHLKSFFKAKAFEASAHDESFYELGIEFISVALEYGPYLLFVLAIVYLITAITSFSGAEAEEESFEDDLDENHIDIFCPYCGEHLSFPVGTESASCPLCHGLFDIR